MHQIGQHLASLVRDDADRAERVTLRLDPPHLGAVTLDIASRNGEVHVVMRVEGPAAAQQLAAQRDQLRSALDAQGLSLAGFDIQQERGERQHERQQGSTARERLSGVAATGAIDPVAPTSEGVLFL